MKSIIPASELVEGNTDLAEFMGYVYKCNSIDFDHHLRQLFNEDGTPKRSGTAIESEWGMWNPHKDWNDIMEIVKKIEVIGETEMQYGTLVDICTTHVKIGHIVVAAKHNANKGLPKEALTWKAMVMFVRWRKENPAKRVHAIVQKIRAELCPTKTPLTNTI